jgi:hypothetical protein
LLGFECSLALLRRVALAASYSLVLSDAQLRAQLVNVAALGALMLQVDLP